MGFLNSLMPKIFLVKKPCGKCSYTVFLESSKLIVNWGLKLKNFLEKSFSRINLQVQIVHPEGFVPSWPVLHREEDGLDLGSRQLAVLTLLGSHFRCWCLQGVDLDFMQPLMCMCMQNEL